MKVRIGIWTSAELLRSGIRAFARESGFEVVSEGADDDQDLLQGPSDVLVAFFSAKTQAVCGKLTVATVSRPLPPIVLLTRESLNASDAMLLLEAGVRGILSLKTPLDRFGRCVEVVSEGNHYFDPTILPEAAHWSLFGGTGQPTGLGAFPALTPREREIWRGVVAGRRIKEIAEGFGTAGKTVSQQKGLSMQKLNVQSTAELVKLAMRMGVVPCGELPARAT